MARVKKVLNKNTGNYVTYDVVTENYDNVKSVMDSYVEECNVFNTNAFDFLNAQIDYISTTGRNAYGEVDSNDALSSNVINEIQIILLRLNSVFANNVISFDEQAKSSAKEKDEEETENNKKSAIRQDNNNVLY